MSAGTVVVLLVALVFAFALCAGALPLAAEAFDRWVDLRRHEIKRELERERYHFCRRCRRRNNLGKTR